MEIFIPDSHIEEILAKISARIPYIDKVNIWLDDRSYNIKRGELEKFCGRLFVKKKPMSFSSKWIRKIELLQPRKEAFLFLKENLSCDYLINYFEPSLDFIVETQSNLRALQEFFDKTLIKKWHLRNHIKKWGTGHYLAPRKSSSNALYYTGKLSKVNGKLCCHLEMRFKGKSAVNMHGIKSFDDLIEFSHRDFWGRHLNLRRINTSVEKIGNAILKKNAKPQHCYFRYSNVRRKIGTSFLRAVQIGNEDDSVTSVQAFIDLGRNFNLRRYVKEIPNERFLP